MDQKKASIDDDHQLTPNYRGAKALPFIVGNEAFEKLGSTGIGANLQVYLVKVFNIKKIHAVYILNTYAATCDLATIPGAFLSDAYFGRYTVIAFASLSSLLGMFLLTLTSLKTFHPPHCEISQSTNCQNPNSKQLALLFTSFFLLTISAGGIRPCNLAFGVDQFNPKTESGKKGINSFFNWYYFTFTCAVMIALTIIVYIQTNKSWLIGFSIPTFLMFVSCIVFFAGKRIYVRVVPQGSPLTSIVQVIVCSVRKRGLKLYKEDDDEDDRRQPWSEIHDHFPMMDGSLKLPSTDQFKFLDKAAIITPDDEILPDGSASNPWRLSSIQQIEEVKCLIRILPIWISSIIFFLSLGNLNNYTTFQALQSNRNLTTRFKIPPGSYGVFSMLTLTIWIPIYDRIVIPNLKKITKEEQGITLLQRIGIGILIASITLIISGFVEKQRRGYAITKPIIVEDGNNVSSFSAHWFIIQMSLVGFAEAFGIIGLIEFNYKQFPEKMKSFSGAFMSLGFAFSNYLNNLLISMIHKVSAGGGDGGENWLAEDLNKGRLEYFYYLIGVIEILNFGYFLVCSKWYKYKRIEEDEDDNEEKKEQEMV
ncbi:protein NRT1/ PTR FAMILY 2.11-like [Impatiens glandulifera]|uniref:protein NRT1/ PTR FAMILY 2.11-like n=1 Tax=Impatiens glandulifera TaxID=253017 RepID=UPI001FB17664|nr:protein NRT1/ PTR FAMILY 2.11-like [Impatiens glandulifera]